jgi:hypothetical protein
MLRINTGNLLTAVRDSWEVAVVATGRFAYEVCLRTTMTGA